MSLVSYEPLDEARLKEVCRQRTAESQTLDFKQTLPGTSDGEKREFLKDVCALANAEGGDLVYGVAEDAGVATTVSPITGEAPDAAKRRLGQIADAGLEPRALGIQFKDIPVSGGYVLIVRVPESYNSPHRIGANGRFVMRSGTHTSDLTYDQLRTAFDKRATLAERARRFLAERLDLISSMKVGKGLMAGPKAVVHLVPISAMTGRTSLDIHALYQHPNYPRFMFPGWSGGISRATNLDGLLVYAEGTGGMQSYVQVFRSGILEAGRSAASQHSPAARPTMPSGMVTRFFRDVIAKLLEEGRTLGFSGAGILGTALVSTINCEFAISPEHHNQPGRVDRNHLVFPEVWIDRLEDQTDIDQIARPMLDMLWQAFDVERCPYFDEAGKWTPR